MLLCFKEERVGTIIIICGFGWWPSRSGCSVPPADEVGPEAEVAGSRSGMVVVVVELEEGMVEVLEDGRGSLEEEVSVSEPDRVPSVTLPFSS